MRAVNKFVLDSSEKKKKRTEPCYFLLCFYTQIQPFYHVPDNQEREFIYFLFNKKNKNIMRF